jgi:amino acid adenylation domain-containing protein
MPESFLLNKNVFDNSSTLIENFKSIPLLKFPVLTLDEVNIVESDSIVGFTVDNDLLNSIAEVVKQHDIPASLFFIAVFNILLQRYTNQDDIFITQMCSGKEPGKQPHADDYLNSFCGVRSMIDPDKTFNEILDQLKATKSEKSASECLTLDNFGQLFSKLNVGPEIFKALFNYTDNNDFSSNELYLDPVKELNHIKAYFKEFYIGLYLKKSAEGLTGNFYFNSNFVDRAFVIRIKDHFLNLLSCIISEPNESIGQYQILSSLEWQQIIVEFNDTKTPYSDKKLIYSLFEENAIKTPDAVALIKGATSLTYHQLNSLSNRLAHYLINQGVLPGDNIGLLVGRDFNMIIGMLAILKAGGAYVPIDPDYPIERQEYIFNQSLIKIVVADKSYPVRSLIEQSSFLCVDFMKPILSDNQNPSLDIDSKQLAYTIYTSGSTGKPKGVMIEHHSAVNLISWVNERFSVNGEDSLLFITSMCFDLSVYDVFGILAAGGKLVIAEHSEIQDVKQLQRMIRDYNITFWDSVPTTLDYLIQNLESEEPEFRYNGLRIVFLSGDWIPKSLPDRIKKFMPKTEVISLGGATEGTVWSNYFPVKKTQSEWNSIPYGKPIKNNFFYILNKQLQPVPYGVPGDLYIGGVGVARGYANDAQKTNAAFMPDPFNKEHGGRMYKTGDLGRMMLDLNMEFIGRVDNQVKIQGFRIELGEIENVLKSCSHVSNAVVLADDDLDGKKRLVAYVVPEQTSFDKKLVVAYLHTKLPEYMVPAIWIEMSALPLTSNGKIDRKSLPAVSYQQTPLVNSTIPLTDTERTLKLIWEECMNKSDINIHANFFELGGHSLMAVQILSRLKKRTGKSFQLSMLFKHPDIKSLASFIDGNEGDIKYVSLVAVKASGYKPPLYIIHGEGLNVLNFSNLAVCIDIEQPIYGLQAKGLNEIDTPLDSIPDIARHYVDEILLHNPEGPYLLSGYSFGGYVAVEMNKQLTALGKEVRMLIMFDTNAEKTEYKDWYKLFPKKVKRKIPKLLSFLKLSLTRPVATFKGQTLNISKKVNKLGSKEFYQQIKKIKQKHLLAFRKYQMEPFDKKVFLFKANICVHYVNDEQFLGWNKYAQKGVSVLEVPGDHLSMLEYPHVEKLAKVLQQEIDKSIFLNNPF